MQGPEEDQDWKNKDDELRISRLRQRRGRSIVHRSLEDNYGAVVVANHEALAQFLDQVFFPSFFFPLPPPLRFFQFIFNFSLQTLSKSLYYKIRDFYSRLVDFKNKSIVLIYATLDCVEKKILVYNLHAVYLYRRQFIANNSNIFTRHRTFYVIQLNQTPQVPAGLRALKNTNPRVSHFGIDANTSITVGRRIFCSATWNELNVTLCIAFDLATHVSRKEFYLAPIIEFIDSPPKEIIDNGCLPTNKQLEGISSYHVASRIPFFNASEN